MFVSFLEAPFRTFLSLSRRSKSTLFVTLACVSLGLSACKSDPPDTVSPNDESDPGEEAVAEPNPAQTLVAQVPDPPELERAAQAYWRGEYENVATELDAQTGQWTAPDQQRALGLAHAWIALAHAESLPENATSHIDAALVAAQELRDKEIQQLATIAKALSLIAMSDAASARNLLAESYKDDGHADHLLHIARAKLSINLAFDQNERLAHPEQLEVAKKSYQSITLPETGTKAAIMGHVHEGLAAIAKFQGDTATQCSEAKKAAAAYQQGNASELLRAGPEQLIREGGCTG